MGLGLGLGLGLGCRADPNPVLGGTADKSIPKDFPGGTATGVSTGERSTFPGNRNFTRLVARLSRE